MWLGLLLGALSYILFHPNWVFYSLLFSKKDLKLRHLIRHRRVGVLGHWSMLYYNETSNKVCRKGNYWETWNINLKMNIKLRWRNVTKSKIKINIKENIYFIWHIIYPITRIRRFMHDDYDCLQKVNMNIMVRQINQK